MANKGLFCGLIFAGLSNLVGCHQKDLDRSQGAVTTNISGTPYILVSERDILSNSDNAALNLQILEDIFEKYGFTVKAEYNARQRTANISGINPNDLERVLSSIDGYNDFQLTPEDLVKARY